MGTTPRRRRLSRQDPASPGCRGDTVEVMTEWDGRGLPPAAQARVDRASTDGVRSSLLSVRGQTGMFSAGFDPVGEVMGCIVERIGWAGWGGCGMYYGRLGGGFGNLGMSAPTITSGSGGGYGGFAPYVEAIYRGWDTAMHRMLLEAQALGADGVVGVAWTRSRLGEGDAQEFVVRGTAVRARSQSRPAFLFSTDLSGGDVAKLLHAGWAPTQLVWGISVSIRHDDYQTRMAAGAFNWQNVEVPGYTELVTYARADARARFEQRCAQQGSESATVSNISLNVREIEPSENHRDHIAEATVVGNSLVKFHQGATAPTDSRVVLPLRRSIL
jgi:uncharacterized protein YbjQ (UPF0145 family)